MASLVTVSSLTLNPQEVTEISRVILEKRFQYGELSRSHAIEMGVDMKQQIVFAGTIADSLKKATGCTPNAGTGVAFTQKYWEPEIFDSRWTHCQADVNKLLKIFQRARKMNPDFYDKIDSQELGLIASLIDQMLTETLPTKIWFSDKDAELIADGGEFKAGTDLDLYNVIDGLWKQIFAEINSGDSNYVAITKNAAASYALQKLADDEAVTILGSVFDVADSRLINAPDAKLYVTRSIADNFRKTLRSKTLGAGFLEVMENGRPTLRFEGYEVEIRDDWDRDIKALFDNGTVLDKPHRVLFTTPDNIPVATLSTEDFKTLNSFYYEYGKSNVIDFAMTLDAKFLEPYMAVAAY